jgi:hypothetical protein
VARQNAIGAFAGPRPRESPRPPREVGPPGYPWWVPAAAAALAVLFAAAILRGRASRA